MAERLFLDDLYVGQRFTSEPHLLDAEQIHNFAAEFDPQPFHLSDEGAAGTLFPVAQDDGGVPEGVPVDPEEPVPPRPTSV